MVKTRGHSKRTDAGRKSELHGTTLPNGTTILTPSSGTGLKSGKDTQSAATWTVSQAGFGTSAGSMPVAQQPVPPFTGVPPQGNVFTSQLGIGSSSKSGWEQEQPIRPSNVDTSLLNAETVRELQVSLDKAIERATAIPEKDKDRYLIWDCAMDNLGDLWRKMFDEVGLRLRPISDDDFLHFYKGTRKIFCGMCSCHKEAGRVDWQGFGRCVMILDVMEGTDRTALLASQAMHRKELLLAVDECMASLIAYFAEAKFMVPRLQADDVNACTLWYLIRYLFTASKNPEYAALMHEHKPTLHRLDEILKKQQQGDALAADATKLVLDALDAMMQRLNPGIESCGVMFTRIQDNMRAEAVLKIAVEMRKAKKLQAQPPKADSGALAGVT